MLFSIERPWCACWICRVTISWELAFATDCEPAIAAIALVADSIEIPLWLAEKNNN